MIHLAFSYWWLLRPLAIVLVVIPFWRSRNETGLGQSMVFCFWAFISLAVFLIVLALLVGLQLGK